VLSFPITIFERVQYVDVDIVSILFSVKSSPLKISSKKFGLARILLSVQIISSKIIVFQTTFRTQDVKSAISSKISNNLSHSENFFVKVPVKDVEKNQSSLVSFFHSRRIEFIATESVAQEKSLSESIIFFNINAL
jgi:hypothetical protein